MLVVKVMRDNEEGARWEVCTVIVCTSECRKHSTQRRTFLGMRIMGTLLVVVAFLKVE
jgi:hypothetical protein